MKFLILFFREIFLDEFIIVLVDLNGQVIDGHVNSSSDKSASILEASNYFGLEEGEYLVYS